MSARPTAKLYYGAPEEEAFGAVMTAIEEAMDVPSLEGWAYGELASLHSLAGWQIGQA